MGDLSRRLNREVATALNAVSRKAAFEGSKLLAPVLPVKPVKILKKVIKQKIRATPDSLSATLSFWAGFPFPVKYLGAKAKKAASKRSSKVGGYVVHNTLNGGKFYTHNAFIAERFGNNAYQHIAGSRRLRKIYGPSPGEAYKQTNYIAKVTEVIRQELPKQMERRIRFILLKQAGGLRGKQN